MQLYTLSKKHPAIAQNQSIDTSNGWIIINHVLKSLFRKPSPVMTDRPRKE